MAQLPTPADAADVWEVELDLDDSDIRLDAPSPSPTPRSCTTTLSHEDKPPHPAHRHRRIPEPASATQDTTRRRLADGSPLPLGRAGARGPDADFLLPPWLRALRFLGKDRAWAQPGIEAIRSHEELRRAPLVAGVVTSCKPNGLGDLLISLKDPTDTIAAAVHKKVLLDGNNGQDISVGCVILLSKVAIFRPTRKACYLNVTKVIKVFRKDCDAPSKQVISTNTTERSEGSTQDSDNENLRRAFDNEKMLHISKKLKSDAILPDGSCETASSRIDTENNQVLKRNMNSELDGMSEQFNDQHASIREPIEDQQRNFTTVNAGGVQPTKEYAPSISGSLLNPKKALPVASLAEWTDDQVSELFVDY